jgi:3-oxoacyl-[acyl-carrier protein] reductase
MNGFVRAAALETAKKGITVNAIEPGNIRNRPPGSAQARRHARTMEPAIPMGHLGEPEDIAWAAVYLASDEARYVTGQMIIVDGGQILPESPAAIL